MRYFLIILVWRK